MPAEEEKHIVCVCTLLSTDHDMSTTVCQMYIRQNSVSGNSAFQMNTQDIRNRTRTTDTHAKTSASIERVMEKINGTKLVDK